MADIVEIVKDGVVKITHNGQEIELPFATVLCAADDIVARYGAPRPHVGPLVPEPPAPAELSEQTKRDLTYYEKFARLFKLPSFRRDYRAQNPQVQHKQVSPIQPERPWPRK